MRYKILTAALLIFWGGAVQADAGTLEDIISKHTEARGGASAIEAIKAIRVKLEIIEPNFTVTGDYVATRDGFMRIDIYAEGERVFTEALGPDGGWQMFADGRIEGLSEDGEKALQRGVVSNLFGLHEREAHGHNLQLAGDIELDGKTFIGLVETAPDGFEKTLFLDPENYLVVHGMEVSALHPDIDPAKQQFLTVNSAFSTIDGVVFSDMEEKYDRNTGDVVQRSRVTERLINPTLDRQLFLKPSVQ